MGDSESESSVFGFSSPELNDHSMNLLGSDSVSNAPGAEFNTSKQKPKPVVKKVIDHSTTSMERKRKSLEKPKPRTKPMDFQELLQLASEKQLENSNSSARPKSESRLLTSREKQEARERARRELIREGQLEFKEQQKKLERKCEKRKKAAGNKKDCKLDSMPDDQNKGFLDDSLDDFLGFDDSSSTQEFSSVDGDTFDSRMESNMTQEQKEELVSEDIGLHGDFMDMSKKSCDEELEK